MGVIDVKAEMVLTPQAPDLDHLTVADLLRELKFRMNHVVFLGTAEDSVSGETRRITSFQGQKVELVGIMDIELEELKVEELRRRMQL